MSTFFSLLPLALDAGTPQETERDVVRKPRIEPAPLPEAWLESPTPPSRLRAALPLFGVLLAIVLGVGMWEVFTPPAAYVAPTTQDSACPAPDGY